MKILTIIRKWSIPAILVIVFGMVSCKKENQPSGNDANIQAVADASADDATMQNTFNEVFDDIAGMDDATTGEDLGIYGSTGAGIFSSEANVGGTVDLTNQPTDRCFTVTIDPIEKGVFPKTVTIDFGDGCKVRGHNRKGKIITVFTGRLHIPGNKATTTFEDYYVDEFHIEGIHTIENTASPGSNERNFTVAIENARVTNTLTERWCTWNSTKHFVQVEGNGTPFWPLDDVFEITGHSRGECSNGKSWSAETLTPLVKEFSCRWISEGTIKIIVNNFEGIFDYGNGACDNEATLTVDGQTRTITLR